jgi:hypothetical protein
MALPDRTFTRNLVPEKGKEKNWEYRMSVYIQSCFKRLGNESSPTSEFFSIIRAHQTQWLWKKQEFNFNGAPQAPQTPQWDATAVMSV